MGGGTGGRGGAQGNPSDRNGGSWGAEKPPPTPRGGYGGTWGSPPTPWGASRPLGGARGGQGGRIGGPFRPQIGELGGQRSPFPHLGGFMGVSSHTLGGFQTWGGHGAAHRETIQTPNRGAGGAEKPPPTPSRGHGGPLPHLGGLPDLGGDDRGVGGGAQGDHPNPNGGSWGGREAPSHIWGGLWGSPPIPWGASRPWGGHGGVGGGA